jgi:hypothetical protein
MNAKTKSILIIIGSLFLGMVIGALSTGAVMNNRIETLQTMRMQDGLMRYLERVIEPIDENQQIEIRSILQRTSRKQIDLRRSVLEEHRILFSELRSELDDVLSPEQKDQLRAWAESDRRAGRIPPELLRRRAEEGRFRRPGFGGRRDSMQADSMRVRYPRDQRREREAAERGDSTSVEP